MPKTGAKIELLTGATWTDITSDVYLRDSIKITRGRQDQASRVTPASCDLTINNKSGTYSPRNPVSPLYGQIGRNTPLRVSTHTGAPYLDHPATTVYRVSTPSTAALQITGDLDVRFDVETSAWNSGAGAVELAGKWGGPGQNSWHAYIFSGFAFMTWTTDGTTEVTAAARFQDVAHPRRMCVRVTMDVNNGAGGRDVAFYTGPSLAGPWTPVGGVQTFAGTAATASSTAGVEIGDSAAVLNAHVDARIYAAQIRSGIDGTVVASPDFTAQAVGALTFTDGAGVPWTANSASALTNRQVRMVGEVAAWPARWDVSGGDVYVPAQAAGIMRRLGNGVDPLQSTLRRRVPSDPNLIAYWPMEDGPNATRGYSPLPGVSPMATSGMTFAQDDTLAGSSALPVLGSASSMSGPVPSSATGAWRLEFVYRIDTAPAGDFNAQFVVVQTSQAQWRVGVGASTIHLDVTDPDGNSLVASAIGPTSDFFGAWSRFILHAKQVGSTVSYELAWTNIGGGSLAVSDTYTGTAGHVTRVTASHGSALQGMPFGHIAVFSAYDSGIFNDADLAFDGETVDTRMTRLAAEEGVPLLAPYGLAGDTLMGPQRPDTLLNLLGDCADADAGILYEARDAISLSARGRISLYNQRVTLALDYSARGEVAPPLEPTEDDDATRNDVTRSRPSGSSARATLDAGALSTQAPPLGVGRYADTQAVNVHSDDQLPDIASWWLHLGTWDEARYPSVTVNLAAAPWLVDAVAAVDVGDRIQITTPPPWLAPDTIDLIVQGYSETIGWADWTVTFNCTPAGPWSVGTADDPVYGRADTDGSQLAAAVSATDTLLPVTVTAGPLWVTTASNAAEFPFDIRVGGEVMTVTGIGGSVVDAYGRTVASGWGTADSGQAWTTSGGSAGDFTVQGV